MGQALQVVKCDFNAQRNNEEHRTSEISTGTLIVRRGQQFTIIVHFRKEIKKYLKNLKKLSLVAQTGLKSINLNGPEHEFAITNLRDKKSWSAAVEQRDMQSWTVSVTTPANAAIGQYSLRLKVSTTLHTSVHKLGDFVLLFNPWCPADDVYLNNEAQRQEYVLNEDGIIYRGTESSIQPYPWNFGQCDEEVLKICLQLLDVHLQGMDPKHRGFMKRNNPVHITRVICAMVNCNDDKGILFGKWCGEYDGGTSPGRWKGSVPILRQWSRTSCQPVRYGQCWVFAAVLCSVLRCLGIPTRVVTNFNSAHDTDGNMVVDEYYDEHGSKIKNNRKDSIWNFHVWNECWMVRKDLPEGYDGWQALDATPQEKSKGTFCCGPAPVRAIREGDVDLMYDCAFIFAEVNADCVVWVYHSNGQLEKVSCNTKYVGNYISTKSIGSDRCEDITHSYKYPEGSPKERQIFQKAMERNQECRASLEDRRSRSSLQAEPQESSNVLITIQSKNSCSFGRDIKLSVTVANNSLVGTTLHLTVGAQSLHYNGVTQNQFWKEEFNLSLLANEEKTITARVVYSQYEKVLQENNLLRITAVALGKEPRSTLFAQQDITISKPSITIEMPEKATVYNTITTRISLFNPLPEALENCELTVEGKGLISNGRTYRYSTIAPGGSLTQVIQFTPTQTGVRRLNLDLDCNKFQDIKGYRSLEVLPG
ncbi:protein-glutamine gamma-glutamyltransferase 5-like [Ambystoma mexicanum]|uniref:protein-glutamine gamma-glutamyltransferase 5-like n=1 Tax=Ambystoma mexicanum TaxID=8296 RepID=UPI0037E86D63